MKKKFGILAFLAFLISFACGCGMGVVIFGLITFGFLIRR